MQQNKTLEKYHIICIVFKDMQNFNKNAGLQFV